MLIEIESGFVGHEEIRRIERTATGCNIFIAGSSLPHPSKLTVEDIFERLPIAYVLTAEGAAERRAVFQMMAGNVGSPNVERESARHAERIKRVDENVTYLRAAADPDQIPF